MKYNVRMNGENVVLYDRYWVDIWNKCGEITKEYFESRPLYWLRFDTKTGELVKVDNE